jgi:endoglucanase
MNHFRNYLFTLALGLLLILFAEKATAQVQFTGVNLAGAEFGEGHLPGIYNQHYTYPTKAEVDYFTGKGMNIFRLPFRWERLQPSAHGSLNTTELSRINNFVNYAVSKKAYVILDPHNYARYYGDIIGSTELPVSAFEDFWKKLAEQFKNNAMVIFGLMNEPHSMATELWLNNANAAIAAIRSTGAENLVLVPGNAWTGAHSWNSNWYGTPNSTVMLNITDSLNNYAYEVHQYLDSNSSGTSATCVSTGIGVERLKNFTSWLRTHNKRGFLGEFAGTVNETCMAGIDNMLAYTGENADVWLGWTWWAAGPWWGNYMFSVEPVNGNDKPQMAVLEKHFANLTTGTNTLPENKTGFSLHQNFPNPFNESTEIEFYLSEPGFIELSVFNTYGQKVGTLAKDHFIAGRHSVKWNARDVNGEKVAGGFYVYCLTNEKNNKSSYRKMLVLN